MNERQAAIDWRKNWRGEGQHASMKTVPNWDEPAYSRDVAVFDYRERQGFTEPSRWGANADVFTTHVFRHPEYQDAMLRHDPRSVFYPVRERRVRALRELRKIAERNRAYRARFGRDDPPGWRSKANRKAAA